MSVLNDLVKERENAGSARKAQERSRKIVEYGVLCVVAIVAVINYDSIMTGLAELMRSALFKH